MADLSRFQHPRFARIYERISAVSEQRGTAEQRHRALAEQGRTAGAGAGAGGGWSRRRLPADDGSYDAAAAIAAAGFRIDQLDRFAYAPLRFSPTHAHILGRASVPRD